ncbi:hypothetical protein DFS33DRAFT_1274282 [Desarmillaria ectypa]|nr:hypothetical protein DFS33DRAFT_1274282 [Desarmillaria ectypa]
MASRWFVLSWLAALSLGCIIRMVQPGPEVSQTSMESNIQRCRSIGGVITAQNMDFVLMEKMSMNFSARINNRNLGLFVSSTTPRYQRLLTKLWDDGSLLNPVIGLRLDPNKPRLTIEALDSED